MNADDKPDILKERLDAVVQSLEILQGMQHANERRFEQITHTFETALDSIKRLENIAVAHDERLDDLEKH